MAYEIGFVDNTGTEGLAHWQMLEKIRRFALGYGTAAAPVYVGTGNGTLTGLDTYPATVTETWTVTATSATAFSVTGSVSGAKAGASVGTPYDNSLLKFTLNAGATAFVAGDKFTIAATVGALPAAARWTQLRYTTPTDGSSRELILKGVGLSGTTEVYIGFRSYHDVSADYYNLVAAAFTGYVAGNTWAMQPGMRESGIPAHNQRVDYYLQANAQRINLGLKVTGPVYLSGGAGLYFPLGTPGQIPLPLYVAGMLNGAPATRYSDVVMSMAWKGNRPNLAIRFLDGTWKTPLTYPWNNARVGGATSQLRDTNNNYPVLKITLCEATPNLFGWLDGIGYVSNFNNTVESMVQVGGTPVTDNVSWTPQQRADAIIAAGGTPWVCLQDVSRTSFNDYFAMELK